MDGFLFTIFGIIVFLYSVVIHEVSHGLMARSLGDNTAQNMGRLTLNPIKHLDAFGSIILPLLLILVRSPFVFGYAKPVPYNPDNLTDKRYGPSKVAFAGPAANLILAILFGLVLRLLGDSFLSVTMAQLLQYIVWINLVLALFNLIPIPPLDGHWLLLTFLPARFIGLRMFLYRYSLVLLFLVIFFIFPYLYQLIIQPLFWIITGWI